jgi:hypothetical protein
VSKAPEPPLISDTKEGLEALQYREVVEANNNGINLPHHLRFLKNSPITSIDNSMAALPIPNPPYTTNQHATIELLFDKKVWKSSLLPTPFNTKEFIRLTANHPNQPLVVSLADGFENGFSSNIRGKSSTIQRHRNHNSAMLNQQTISMSRDKELGEGRTAVVTDSLLRSLPYSTSNPLGVLDQSKKKRIIVDKSFGDGDGINSRILAVDYGTLVLDSVQTICDQIRKAFVSGREIVFIMEDVTAYYRNLPVQARDCPHQLIVYPDGEIVIDFCENFGDRGAPFKSGYLGDVICWIMQQPPYSIESPFHYSDNFFAVSTVANMDRERDSFRRVFADLNLPLNDKDSKMGKEFNLIGFDWDIKGFTVSIPKLKREGIVEELITILRKESIDFKRLSQITGKLVWAAQIIRSANCFVSMLWKAGTKYERITAGREWSERNYHKIKFDNEPHVRDALMWFKKTLMVWSGTSYLRHFDWLIPQRDDVLGCASDASKVGGSFTTPTSYSYWVWCDCCVKRAEGDMTLLEIASTLIGFSSAIASQMATRRVLWVTDNKGSSDDYKKGYAKECEVTSQIVAELHAVAIQRGIDLLVEWVPREFIKRTDILTRGSDKAFLAMEGEKRRYIQPYSGESLFVFDVSKKPVTIGFCKFHPEISI